MYLNDILHRRLNLITLKGSITVTTCDAPLFRTTQSAALHPSGVHSDLITEALWTFIVHAIWATSRRATMENLLLSPWQVFVETVKRFTTRSHEASALVLAAGRAKISAAVQCGLRAVALLQSRCQVKIPRFQKCRRIKINNNVSFFFIKSYKKEPRWLQKCKRRKTFAAQTFLQCEWRH